MMAELVLTVIARDRPGVVRTLANVIATHSGSWVDSSMARLGGEFAGILRVRVPAEEQDALKVALAALHDDGITVVIRDDAPAPTASGTHVRLHVTGLDHTGIVRDVADILSMRTISFDELRTAVFPASMGGQEMFSAQADVVLPDGVTSDALRGELEALATDLMVEIELHDTDESDAR